MEDKTTSPAGDPRPPPSDDSTAPVGRLLGTVLGGRYRVDSLLGSGGQGEVYRPVSPLCLLLVLSKRAPWCDLYEPNADRRVNPWGPLASGQVYWARLCAGDPRDNYYFETTTTNPVRIRLQLPPALVGHTALWLYAPGNLTQPICGGGPIQTGDHTLQCQITQPGRYVVSLYTDGPSDDVNPYALQVTFQ